MFLYIDKPKGITSHDVVNRIRGIVTETGYRMIGISDESRIGDRNEGNRNEEESDESRVGNKDEGIRDESRVGNRNRGNSDESGGGNRNENDKKQYEKIRIRVGHAGTLDPNATGLLIIGVGRESTKELWTKFGKMDKTYIAEIILGEERETDDTEGASRIKYQVSSIRTFSRREVGAVLRSFKGEQMQMPPTFSAIKVKGQPAYKLARKGKEIKLKPRKISIHSIKLLGYNYPIIKIETRVSSGTYIRALARDLGRKLGCGAYLSNLRRTRIGKYKVEDSVELDKYQKTGRFSI